MSYESCQSSVAIISAEHAANRSGVERLVDRNCQRGPVPRINERGGAMYDRRSRQPITP